MQLEREDVEERRVGLEEAVDVQSVLPVPEEPVAAKIHDRCLRNARHAILEGLCEPRRHRRGAFEGAHGRRAKGVTHVLGPHDGVNPVGLRVEAVVPELVPHVQPDDEAYGEPDGQSHDVDRRVADVPAKRAKRNREVVAKDHFVGFGFRGVRTVATFIARGQGGETTRTVRPPPGFQRHLRSDHARFLPAIRVPCGSIARQFDERWIRGSAVCASARPPGRWRTAVRASVACETNRRIDATPVLRASAISVKSFRPR